MTYYLTLVEEPICRELTLVGKSPVPNLSDLAGQSATTAHYSTASG